MQVRINEKVKYSDVSLFPELRRNEEDYFFNST